MYPGVQHRLRDASSLAVTIDDGPASHPVDALLELLDSQRMLTTWFFSGEAVRRLPETARAIVDAGHEAATHGNAHRGILRFSDQKLRDDIARSLDSIENATGVRPTIYRPPYGRILPRQLSIVRALGCRTVLWSQLPGDWNHRLPQALLRQRLARLRGGDILVLHDREHRRQQLMQNLRIVASVLRGKHLHTVPLGDGERLP